MQQHSGQHLLSAICARELNAATVSFHLGEEVATIDLATESLTQEQLLRLEEQVNLAIAENAPVSIRTVEADEAQALLATGSLRKLPERAGAIRLIEMPGIDLNACGGTHVQALGQIGGLLLRGTERVKQGIRLSFVCGLRAARAAHRDDLLLTQLAAGLSVPRASLPEAIDRKLSESKRLAKEQQRLREDLADYHAARLLVEDPIEHGKRIVVRQFPDRDAAYIKLLASRLVAASPQTVALLASTELEPASLVFARSADLGSIYCGELLTSALAAEGLRGGGSPSMAQGQAPATILGGILEKLKVAVRA
jgi:alanyl-tRNA synthetase